MENKLKIEPRRYDGPLKEVADLAKTAKKERDALIKLLEQLELFTDEISKATALSKSLPNEIDELLRCGRMDEKTVEALARKRAHLDLIPGRLNSVQAEARQLEKSAVFEAAFNKVQQVVYKAGILFTETHLQAAVNDYMSLGVSSEIAAEQVNLRPDIDLQHERFSQFSDYISCTPAKKIRRYLAALDCFAEGSSPESKGTEEIKKVWLAK